MTIINLRNMKNIRKFTRSRNLYYINNEARRSFLFLYISIIILTLIFQICAAKASAENTNEIFPKLLSVKYKNGKLEIKFEPLKNEAITYKIYRSTSPILGKTDLEESKLVGTITKSDLPFFDTPEMDGRYYYAVIAVLNKKDIFKLVPLQNTLMYPAQYSPYPKPVKIIRIAKSSNTGINIYFGPVKKDWQYSLYISTDTIDNKTFKLLKPYHVLKPKRDADTSMFSINIEPDKKYYFAITVTNRLGVTNDALVKGENLTTTPYSIPKELKSEIKPESKKQKSVVTNVAKTPSKTEEKKVSKRKKVTKAPVKKKSVNIDLIIKNTAKYYFNRGNYSRTIRELKYVDYKYKLTPGQKAKIYYLIAQSYYYLGNRKKALKYFILCKDYPLFRKESEGWINRILEEIP